MMKSSNFIELLPQELITVICVQLDVQALASLRQVSKAWKAMVDSDAILKSVCIREGLLSDLSQDLRKPIEPLTSTKLSDADLYSDLRRRGYKEDELSSYWTLLAAKYYRCRGQPFRQDNKESVPTLRRRHFCDDIPWSGWSDGIYQFKIDPIDRVVLTTHQENGGLTVSCLDTGEPLSYQSSVQGRARLAFSEGWALTTACTTGHQWTPPDQFKIWRLDRTFGNANPKRGSVREEGSLPCKDIGPFRFHFPCLAVLTKDMRLQIFDVPNKKLLEDFDVKPTMPLNPSDQGWEPFYIDFDDEYCFVLSKLVVDTMQRLLDSLTGNPDGSNLFQSSHRRDWCLQVFSRRGDLVWLLDMASRTVIPRRQKYDFGHLQPGLQGEAHWDQTSKGLKVRTCGWPSDGEPIAVHHDVKTESLCLLYDTNLAIFPQYKKMLQTDHKSLYQPLIVTFAGYREVEIVGNMALTTGAGLASFNLGRSIILVDLARVLANRLTGSVVQFWSPSDHQDEAFDEEIIEADCTGIYIDESLLVYQSSATKQPAKSPDKSAEEGESHSKVGDDSVKDVSSKGRLSLEDSDDSESNSFSYYEEEEEEPQTMSVITMFDFAELGKLRSSSETNTDMAKHGLIELPEKNKKTSVKVKRSRMWPYY